MKDKTKKIIDKAISITCVSTIIACASYLTRQAILSNTKYLKPTAQVEREAEFLDADLSLMEKAAKELYKNADIIRLKPNKGESIYVNIDKNVSSETTTLIKNSLNYFENLFKDINSDYRFKIVNDAEFFANKLIGKTTIKFKMEKFASNLLHGHANNQSNKNAYDKLFNNTSTNLYFIDNVITLNEDVFPTLNEKQKTYTINHELLHCFGLADVYEGYKDYSSYIFNASPLENRLLSPNDIKLLYSAYGNKHINEDGSINNEKLNEFKTKMEAYEQVFHKQSVSDISLIQKNNYINFDKSEIENRLFSFNFLDERLNLVVNDDEYKFTYCGEEFFGKAVVGDNFIAITDILINNENCFFYIVKNEENNRFHMVTIANNFKYLKDKYDKEKNNETLTK